eukprot:sb/3473617/
MDRSERYKRHTGSSVHYEELDGGFVHSALDEVILRVIGWSDIYYSAELQYDSLKFELSDNVKSLTTVTVKDKTQYAVYSFVYATYPKKLKTVCWHVPVASTGYMELFESFRTVFGNNNWHMLQALLQRAWREYRAGGECIINHISSSR